MPKAGSVSLIATALIISTRLTMLTMLTMATPAMSGVGPISRSGPVIEGFGPTYAVPNADFGIPTDDLLRVVFDVARSPDSTSEINPRLESAARYLNLHARAGVPSERIRVALVVHGAAGRDLLNDTAYRSRFGADNPNTALLASLYQAGVEIILCGQTAMHRGFAHADLAQQVHVALSAMTALTVLQNDGYALIAF